MPRVAKVVVAAAFATLAAPALHADVRTVSLDAVYALARCDGDGCSGSKGKLDKGATIAGAIQMHLSAEADIAFNFVRLEARHVDQQTWFCLHRWEPTGSAMDDSYDWNTRTWPPTTDPSWNCGDQSDPDHGHGEPTRNGTFDIRVLARDISGDERTSDPFRIRFNNRPEAPLWRKGATDGATDGAPFVSLSWYAAREPDLRAYVVEREGPDGTGRLVIDAQDPTEQGCGVDGETTEILCRDTGFRAEGSGGEYTYRILTHEPALSGGVRCAIGEGRCLVSGASEERTAKIPGEYVPPTEPAEPQRGRKRGAERGGGTNGGERTDRPGRGRGASGDEPTGPAFGLTPSPAKVAAAAAAAADARMRQALIAAAAALLTFAVAWWRRTAIE